MPSERQRVSRHMRQTPFVAGLDAALGDRITYAIAGKVWPGQIRADTMAPDGYSLRVNAGLSIQKESVSVLNITSDPRGGSRPYVYFSSLEKLRRYLPSKLGEIERFRGLI